MRDALSIIIGVAAIAVPIVAVLWGKRAFDRGAEGALARIYRAAERNERAFSAETPRVEFVYHTYSGILVYVNQAEHRFALPYPVARQTLDELLRYNLRWGFFAYGALLIPVLAYLNHRAQSRSIARQHQGQRPARAR